MPSIRIQRLRELIRQRVAMVLQRDVADPRLRMVTVTKVDLSKDLEHCKVYWSTLLEGGARTAVENGLSDARGFIQREVARIMKTRVTPALEFVFDKSIEGAEELSRILRAARQEDLANMRARGEIPEEDAGRDSQDGDGLPDEN